MSTGVKTFEVDITNPKVISVTANPTLNNTPELFIVAHIEQVTGIFYDYNVPDPAAESQQETYPYPTKTVLVMESSDGTKKLSIELQSVTNQPTWNLGTRAALNAAVAAIKALIP